MNGVNGFPYSMPLLSGDIDTAIGSGCGYWGSGQVMGKEISGLVDQRLGSRVYPGLLDTGLWGTGENCLQVMGTCLRFYKCWQILVPRLISFLSSLPSGAGLDSYRTATGNTSLGT